MSSTSGGAHGAGAFDVRNVIAALIGFYGLVLVLLGLFADSAADRERTGDVNANLWAGLAMLVFAAMIVFAFPAVIWATVLLELEVAVAAASWPRAWRLSSRPAARPTSCAPGSAHTRQFGLPAPESSRCASRGTRRAY